MTIDELPVKPYMHPCDIFRYMVDCFHIIDIDHTVQDNGTEVFEFSIGDNKVPDDFLQSASLMSKYNPSFTYANFSFTQGTVAYVISKNGNESLVMSQQDIKRRFTVSCGYVKFDGDTLLRSKVSLHIYDNGKAYNYTHRKGVHTYKTLSKGFPCSMKDFFYYQDKRNVLSDAIYYLFQYWGREYLIWRDLAEDFRKGSSYCSVPLNLIFECHNRRELIQKYCGNDLSRNNRESIGKGLFLAKCKKYILPKDYGMLFDYNLPPYFLSRDRQSFIPPLTMFLYNNFKSQFDTMTLKRRGYEVEVTKTIVEDAIRMALQLKIPIKLRFRSLVTFMDWHDELVCIERVKGVPVVRIPKDSVFKKLILPENCVRLTTRKQIVEEGVFQKNCVAGYAKKINADTCSIWSMHKDDGSHITIEICRRFNNFYIKQMLGYSNSKVSDEDRKIVQDYLDKINRKH